MMKHSWRAGLAALALSSTIGLVPACGDDPATSGDVLTRTEDVSPGSSCPGGGQAAYTGVDGNGNGILDDDEIVSTHLECRPVDPPGADLLNDRQPEPPGANCEHGGQVVRSGLDRDHDHILDADEVTSTIYVCDPAPLPPEPELLTRVDVLASGDAHCVAGGAVVLSGADLDHDGVLDDNEIADRSFECETALVGDYLIDSQAAADRLADIHVISGSLRVTAALLAINLPNLAHIGANLVIDVPEGNLSIAFGALEAVGGNLEVSSPQLQALALPLLADVGGHIELYVQAVDELALPELARAAGYIFLAAPPHAFSIPKLVVIHDHFTSSGGLTSFVAPELTESGTLEFLDDKLLERFEAPKLTRVSGEITLLDYAGTTIALPALRLVDDSITLGRARLLRELSLPALESVGGALVVAETPKLASLTLPQLAVAGRLIVRDQALLASLRLPLLTSVTDELGLWTNAQLTFVHAPLLHDLATLEIIDDDALESLAGFAALETVRQFISVNANDHLVDLTGLRALRRVELELHVVGNDSLVHLGIPHLAFAEGIWIGRGYGNQRLALVDLPELAEAGAITVDSNAVLTGLELPALRRTRGYSIALNPMLPLCRVLAVLAQLESTPELVQTNHNDATATCDAP